MLVLAKKFGQLGNRLILYSHLIACAEENNLKLVNIAFDDYAELFEATEGGLFSKFPEPQKKSGRVWQWPQHAFYKTVKIFTDIAVALRCTSFPVKIIRLRGEEPLDLGSDEFLNIARSRRLVLLQGWCFRDGAARQRQADAIRNYFRPLPKHRDNIAQAVAAARTDCDVLVGVHIRHGDYAKHLGGKYFYSLSQYAQAMQAMTQLLPGKKVRFLVCSNVAIDEAEFGDLSVSMGPGHLLEDMYSFAECDYLIGPPSTYTMWASFYGEVPLHSIEDPHASFTLEEFKVR